MAENSVPSHVSILKFMRDKIKFISKEEWIPKSLVLDGLFYLELFKTKTVDKKS